MRMSDGALLSSKEIISASDSGRPPLEKIVRESRFGATRPGDVVGCGVMHDWWHRPTIFFTRNGRFLGFTPWRCHAGMDFSPAMGSTAAFALPHLALQYLLWTGRRWRYRAALYYSTWR